MFFLECDLPQAGDHGFTCASSWNGCLRAPCTMQSRRIIPRTRIWVAKPPAMRKTPSTPSPSHLNALAMSTPASSKHTRSTPLPIYRQVWHPIASIAIGLSLLAPSFAALCKELTRNQTTSNDKANSKKNGTKVTHHRSPSQETRTERDRRLYRECKGMPNAGACLGYTRR